MSCIFVCSLAAMPEHVRALGVRRLVSLLPPHEQPPTPPEIESAHHHRVEIDDITEAGVQRILPEREHVAALIAFLEGWRDDRPLLVHCMAGISRSTAAALIAQAIDSPGHEMRAARALRAMAPHAHPNRRILALADEILGCGGRLIEAREAMGDCEPVLEGPLLRLPRSLRGLAA